MGRVRGFLRGTSRGCILVSCQIRNDCLSDEVSQKFSEFSTEILKKVGSSAFGFDRIYYNGTCQRYCTRPEIVRFLMEEKIRITAPISEELCKENKTVLFLTGTEHPGVVDHAFEEVMVRFGFGTFVEFVEIGTDYYDQFWFHSPNELGSTIAEFWREKAAVEDFITKVKTQWPWLESGRKNPIHLSPEFLVGFDIFKKLGSKSGILESASSPDVGKRKSPQLSQREIQCIALTSIGLTAREMGSVLDISTRTVEYYIENIKDKLGCLKKGQISAAAIELKKDPSIRHRLEETIQCYSGLDKYAFC